MRKHETNKRNLTYFYRQFFLGAWTAMTKRFWGNFQNKFTRKHTFLEKWIPSMLSEWSPLRRAAAPTRCCFACTPLPVQLRILWSRPEQPPAASTALQHYHYTAHSLGTQSVCTLQNMRCLTMFWTGSTILGEGAFFGCLPAKIFTHLKRVITDFCSPNQPANLDKRPNCLPGLLQ